MRELPQAVLTENEIPHAIVTKMAATEEDFSHYSFLDDLVAGCDPFDEDDSVVISENSLASLPDDVLKALDTTEASMKPKTSTNQEKVHTARLLKFFEEKLITCDLSTVREETLDSYLRWFYHDIRTKKGDFYSPPSLKCIRAALHRISLKH